MSKNLTAQYQLPRNNQSQSNSERIRYCDSCGEEIFGKHCDFCDELEKKQISKQKKKFID